MVCTRNIGAGVIVRFAAAALVLALAGPARATLVFDNVSDFEAGNPSAHVTSTASTPNTFMGDGYVLAPGTTAITGFDIFPVNSTGTTFTGLEINLFVWGTVNTSGTVNAVTPAFSDLLATYTLTSSGTFASGFFFPFEGTPDGVNPGISLGSPLAIPGTTIGLTFNYRGTTDGVTYNDINGLSSVIVYGTPPTVGADVFSGYYRNANGETNGNFSSSLRTLGNPDESLAVRIYGETSAAPTTAVPETSSSILTVLALAGCAAYVLARRRRQTLAGQ